MKTQFSDDWLVILFVLLGAAFSALQIVLVCNLFTK